MAQNPYWDQPLPLRLANGGEKGERLLDLLQRRSGNRAAAARIAAVIQEWDVAMDDWAAEGNRGEPTVEYYADRFNMSRTTAHRDLALFRSIFPSERTPRGVLSLLWDARSASRGMLLSARVMET